MLLEILISVGGIAFISTVLYFLIDIITDLQPSLYSNFKYSRREMWNMVCSKDTWKKEETSTHDVELTFDSFKRFVDLNSEGWSWKREYGIYSCNPCFQPSRKEYYHIRFKTYKDYVKAAAYWHKLGQMKAKRKQELAEAKNTAEFLAIQKQRAKDAEEQAARQMRESEEQIMEILERLKNESVTLIPTPADEGKTITLSGSPETYWKVQGAPYAIYGSDEDIWEVYTHVKNL